MREEYDFSAGRRGAVIAPRGKTRISIYIDNAVHEQAPRRHRRSSIPGTCLDSRGGGPGGRLCRIPRRAWISRRRRSGIGPSTAMGWSSRSSRPSSSGSTAIGWNERRFPAPGRACRAAVRGCPECSGAAGISVHAAAVRGARGAVRPGAGAGRRARVPAAVGAAAGPAVHDPAAGVSLRESVGAAAAALVARRRVGDPPVRHQRVPRGQRHRPRAACSCRWPRPAAACGTCSR